MTKLYLNVFPSETPTYVCCAVAVPRIVRNKSEMKSAEMIVFLFMSHQPLLFVCVVFLWFAEFSQICSKSGLEWLGVSLKTQFEIFQ